MNGRKYNFTDANKAFQFYFENSFDVHLVINARFMTGKYKENSIYNWQADNLSVKKELFTTFNKRLSCTPSNGYKSILWLM